MFDPYNSAVGVDSSEAGTSPFALRMAVCQRVASIVRLARCEYLTCAKPESRRYHITSCVNASVIQSTELGGRRRLYWRCVVLSWWKVIIPNENFSRRCWVLDYLQSRRRERKRGGVCVTHFHTTHQLIVSRLVK